MTRGLKVWKILLHSDDEMVRMNVIDIDDTEVYEKKEGVTKENQLVCRSTLDSQPL